MSTHIKQLGAQFVSRDLIVFLELVDFLLVSETHCTETDAHMHIETVTHIPHAP